MDGPAHHVHELLCDAETQAGAFLGGGLACLDEDIEDARLIFRGDPDAGVLHFKNQPRYPGWHPLSGHSGARSHCPAR